MRTSGIVRKIDELGRIVLPIELRRTLGIEERDSLEILLDDDCLVLRKLEARCVFCGADRELLQHRGKKLCTACLRELAEQED